MRPRTFLVLAAALLALLVPAASVQAAPAASKSVTAAAYTWNGITYAFGPNTAAARAFGRAFNVGFEGRKIVPGSMYVGPMRAAWYNKKFNVVIVLFTVNAYKGRVQIAAVGPELVRAGFVRVK